MVTVNQISRGCRGKRKWRSRTPAFKGSPQRRGVCVRVYTTKPKKPNSAVRKIAKVFLPGSNRKVLAYIPGQGHNLSTHSVVFVRGGRVRDVPGMHYKLVRNVYDFVGSESILRTNRRSKYGLKR